MLSTESKDLKMSIGASNMEVLGDLSQGHSGKGRVGGGEEGVGGDARAGRGRTGSGFRYGCEEKFRRCLEGEMSRRWWAFP